MIEARSERFRRLPRDAEHDIKRDIADPRRSCRPYGFGDVGRAAAPSEGFQLRFNGALHTHGDPVHPGGGHGSEKRLPVFQRGIHLHRDLRVRIDVKMRAYTAQKFIKRFRRKEPRRSAAEIHGGCFSFAHILGYERRYAPEGCELILYRVGIGRDQRQIAPGIEIAVGALRGAERHVEVQAECARRSTFGV